MCAKINRQILFLSLAADKAYMEALKENQKFSVSRCYLVSSFLFVV